MKKRQSKILEIVLKSEYCSFGKILKEFSISKRTLYYDLDQINSEIKESGEIKNVGGQLIFIGDQNKKNLFVDNKLDYDKNQRQNLILFRILENSFTTSKDLEDELQVSKNTITTDIADLKVSLSKLGLSLDYDKAYEIIGPEKIVRELYIRTLILDRNLLTYKDKEINEFNKKAKLHLTDYSLSILTKYYEFLKRRNQKGHYLVLSDEYLIDEHISHYDLVKTLLVEHEDEAKYLTLYIASLSSLNLGTELDKIKKFIDDLINNFERLVSIQIEDVDNFKNNILKHLESSYYRIKYNFPTFNPMLDDIKIHHRELFNLVKKSVESTKNPFFSMMRDEEVAFLVLYFGGNLTSKRKNLNRVVIVCPNGLATSKSLEVQLKKYIPTIEVLASIPVYQVEEFRGDFDYYVSTVPLDGIENTIVVNPLLNQKDIDKLTTKLVNINFVSKNDLIDQLISAVEENGIIKDKDKLKQAFIKIIYGNTSKESQPMLKEVLTEGRMARIESCTDWKEAITLAAQPLVNDGTITKKYIENMIESVETHGPYIVLEDYFALPHASSKEGVNEFGMSLLQVEKEVDFLGKPVQVLVVLAAVDSHTHLKALAHLSEILEEDENMDVLRKGNIKDIIELIERLEKEEA